jgi:hypothetical protein
MKNKYRYSCYRTKVRSSDTFAYIRKTGTAGTPAAGEMLATAGRQQQQARHNSRPSETAWMSKTTSSQRQHERQHGGAPGTKEMSEREGAPATAGTSATEMNTINRKDVSNSRNSSNCKDASKLLHFSRKSPKNPLKKKKKKRKLIQF